MNKKGFVTKAACILLVMMLSCVFITACGNSHSISGSYVGEDGSFFEFTSNENVRMYNESKTKYADGTYYWDKDEQCYYMNFNNAYISNMYYKTVIDGNNLIITMNGQDWIYTKK